MTHRGGKGILAQSILLLVLLLGSGALAQFSEPSNAAPSQPSSVEAIDTSAVRQVKSGTDPNGEIKAQSIFLDNELCFDSENPSTCTSSWSDGTPPRCRIETARVAARPKSIYDAVGLGPAFSPDPNPGGNTCNDILSAQSITDGWTAINIDHYNRVQNSDPAPPEVCQFARLVCDGVTVTAPIVNDYPTYPTPNLTKSTNQCSDGKNNEVSFTKLADTNIIGGFPGGASYGSDFSQDGIYLAVAHAGGTFVSIYKRTGDTFARLTPVGGNPAGTGRRVAFAPNGTYLAVTQDVNPYLTIYKRSGDTFTKLPNVASPPTQPTRGVAFSPDSTYLAVAQINAAPFLHIYERSGDTFTKLTGATGPNVQPTGPSFGVDFSPNGTYLAVGHDVSPSITIYKRASNVFTKLADPTPALTGVQTRGVMFSPDSNYLAAAVFTAESVVGYRRTGDSFAKAWDLAASGIPSTSVTFSPDYKYLISSLTSTGIHFYEEVDDVFADAVEPGTLPSSVYLQNSFSPDSQYLAIPHQVSNYLQVYKYSGDGIDFPDDPQCTSWSDNNESA